MLELENKTLTELKALAKENNIKNISKLKKDELIEILKTILNLGSEEAKRMKTLLMTDIMMQMENLL